MCHPGLLALSTVCAAIQGVGALITTIVLCRLLASLSSYVTEMRTLVAELRDQIGRGGR